MLWACEVAHIKGAFSSSSSTSACLHFPQPTLRLLIPSLPPPPFPTRFAVATKNEVIKFQHHPFDLAVVIGKLISYIFIQMCDGRVRIDLNFKAMLFKLFFCGKRVACLHRSRRCHSESREETPETFSPLASFSAVGIKCTDAVFHMGGQG